MSLLIITLPLESLDASALFDCVQGSAAGTVTSHALVPLALLPALDRQTEVVALVPLAALSWHRVQLPKGSLPRTSLAGRSSTRLRAILDGLLEDQLLDDLAQLHLALQPQPQVNEPVWVAVCDRVWLKTALAALAQAGYNAVRIVPESSPQALGQAIEVSGEPDRPRVAGLCGPTGILACALSGVAVAMLMPDAPVLAEPAVAGIAEQLFARPVTLQQHSERLLQAASTAWDLAQFEFTNAERDPRWASLAQGLQSFARSAKWRAARWVLALLVVGQLVGINAWAWRTRSNQEAQRQAIRAVLSQTFPKVAVVVDAPLQMAREVAALQRASGNAAGTDLESILSAFSAKAPDGYTPTTIEYVANELRLSGPPMAAQDQARVTDALTAQGLLASVHGEQWLIRPGVAP
ncbi:GspL periplasmic domain protein [mine drainage metagenome]|uniref:GspL periplasmic domain protein n=1 Tax=mine drainage metagenome TaxID=410659 RepID=A0A1J5PYT9_9ZZZZ